MQMPCLLGGQVDLSKCPKRHPMRQITQILTKSWALAGLNNAGS